MRSEAARILAAALALLLLGACQRAVIKDSAAVQFPHSAQEMQFLEALEKQVVATNDDALHGLIIFADGTDLSTTFEGRTEIARRRGWVDANWSPPPDESAKVGWMAVAGCKIVGIKGGVTMRLFGPTPRYATKELVFMQILPLRTENQSLSGQEFIDYLNRLGRVRRFGQPMVLNEEFGENQAGAKTIPAGAPNQLLDQSAVEFGLPTTPAKPLPPPDPEPSGSP